MLPGEIDSQAHAADASIYAFDHPVPELETSAEVLAYTKSRAALAKDGDWIVFTQIFVNGLRD